jgi:adenine-specific DNA-methyltransferase
MNKPLETFQNLLRELFQFDCADLDFGIYRIMNHKRDVIERFITQDLPKAVAEELDRGALAEQSQAAAEMQEVAAQVRHTLGADALDADGTLATTYHTTPLGKKYLALKGKAADGRGREALEAAIYNQLYAFFSRYYQDGDFISKRRYSKRGRYAIPYNGEEVYLYWANHDQYYIKTAEHFTDYTFIAPNGVSVHFKLQAADVEQINVKGDKRFFLPRLAEIACDEAASQLVIPFEYRPLTEQENIAYGQKNQQDAIIAKTLAEIPKRLSPKTAAPALAALTAEKRMTGDGQPVSFIEHHLRQYTRRNTLDFFIHKDLKGFLSRELDFYLKNEVLNLDEMEAAGEDRAEGWFQMMRVIKAVGGRIIEFLHQIEEFQKMLWEKRKFITETHYCITAGNIAEEFYPDIAACEPQWAEWKELFHIDDEQANLFVAAKSTKGKRIAFVKSHPTLVLDTKHFDRDFADRLLASFDNLDEVSDGLLIHSENWQALNLLQERFASSIKAAYYDPPYNTSEETFVYKNNYRHSSWLAMMHSRIAMLRKMLLDDAALIVAIDDAELYRLKLTTDGALGEDNYLGTIVVQSNPRGRGIGSYYATSHDYYLVYAANADTAKIIDQSLTEDQSLEYRHSDETSEYRLLPFRRSGGLSTPNERPNSEFTLYYSESAGRIIAVGGERKGDYPAAYKPASILCAIGDTFTVSEVAASQFRKVAPKDTAEILPVDSNGARRVWRWSDRRKVMEAALRGDFVVQDSGERISVLLKDRIKEGRKPKTVWADSRYDASSHGTNLLQDILGSRGLFGYPKSIYSTRDALHTIVGEDESSVIMDAFAGSGTTGHAVINLNREDGGRRKLMLVEMADYFNSVLLPRIKKVTYAPEWKDGKPKRGATAEEAERSPRVVQYIRLESYEDTLNNIAFDDSSGQQAMQFDDYLLQYMLKWETRKSETLLNVEKLARPFDYRLRIYADGETRETHVEIPETFNYLFGLHVQTRRVYDDNGRRYLTYRGRIDNRNVAVIWRETEGWQKADFERDKQFVAEQKLAEGADEVFVNGDSFIPGARALEPIFKARMFAPVEA